MKYIRISQVHLFMTETSSSIIFHPFFLPFLQRENVMRLNENEDEILRLLVSILQESNNPVVIAVASHDLGEYVRYYPRGKT